MATTALAVREASEAMVPRTTGAVILKDALVQATEQRTLLVAFVRHHMVRDVDYGVIPGTKKPSLYKPGAEKLTELYRCAVDFKVEKEVEDWDKPFFYYRIRAHLVQRDADGVVLGVGLGSCNSHESKYRWRDAKPKCPKCNAETVFKSQKDPGWYCWGKKGGCGAKWPDDNEPAIINQARGKVENADAADLTNTILKMATKRAHVAAALQLAGCSDLFTQDAEDMPADLRGGNAAELPQVPWEQPAPAPETAPIETHRNPIATAPAPAPSGKAQPPDVRARRVFETRRKMGEAKTTEQFLGWVASVIGAPKLSKDWTSVEVSHLEAAMNDPPSPSDVPF